MCLLNLKGKTPLIPGGVFDCKNKKYNALGASSVMAVD
jgi:hypothetical protein